MTTKGKVIWTDEEAKLLLDCVLQFKTDMIQNGFEWGAVKTKYEEIRELFLKSYPVESSTEYPKTNVAQVITKGQVSGKIKRVKKGYRTAVEKKKRSGAGKVVADNYELCAEIWAGCPAVNALEDGFENSEVGDRENDDENNENADPNLSNDEDDDDDVENSSQSTSATPSTSAASSSSTSKENRHLRYRTERLNKKLSKDQMLYRAVEEETKVKKEMVSLLKEANSNYVKSQEFTTAAINNMSFQMSSTMQCFRDFLVYGTGTRQQESNFYRPPAPPASPHNFDNSYNPPPASPYPQPYNMYNSPPPTQRFEPTSPLNSTYEGMMNAEAAAELVAHSGEFDGQDNSDKEMTEL